MDPELIRHYVKKKKMTFLGTIVLLLLLASEFYYLNCYTFYVFPFCEITWIYIILAIVVANIYWYFSGDTKKKTDSIRKRYNDRVEKT